jgi:spore maturation protein B
MAKFIIPIMVLVIVIHGAYKKINVYDAFVEGSKESFEMILAMFPNLLGMILAINIFLKSNVLTYMTDFFAPVFNLIKVPIEIIPMAIMRPISGSSSLAILNNLLKDYGPDSFIGRLGSVIQGSTDTTLYVLTLYFGSVGIKKIKYALWAGLLSDLIAIICSIIVVNILF